MVEVTATVTTVTKMMRGWMESVPLNKIVGQTTLNSLRHLVDQLATFGSHFATTKWVDKHGFLRLFLNEDKMCLAARYNNLNCEQLAKLEILNPKIEDNIKGHEILQLQED